MEQTSMRLWRAVVVALVLVAVGPAALASAHPAASAKVVMPSIGTDNHQTKLFHINGSEWQIHWTYNCHDQKDNFIIEVRDRSGELVDLAANQLDKGGSDTEYLHQGGTFYLDITSGCSWNIQVTSNDGGGMLRAAGNTTVLAISGPGIHQTRLFRVASEWKLVWSYNCHNTGSPSNFIVEVRTKSGDLAGFDINEIHWSDYGTDYMHRAGTYYLSVISDCKFHIRVLQ